MSNTTNPHEPTPEFRAYLEWQVRSGVRRDARFGAPMTGGRRYRLRTAVILIAGLALGAGAAVASAQVLDARQRDLLLAVAETEQKVGEILLKLRRDEFANTRARFEVGAVGRESLTQAQTEMLSAEVNLKRLRLNRAEIQASGAAPRDEITAPLVGGRDFVGERLNLDLVVAQQKLTAAEHAAAEIERRVQVGAAEPLASVQAQLDHARARADVQLLVHTLGLRAAFLQQKQQPSDVTLRLQRLRVESELQTTQLEHQLMKQRFDLLRQRHSIGQVTQLELLRAELAVVEVAFQVQRLARQLEVMNAQRR